MPRERSLKLAFSLSAKKDKTQYSDIGFYFPIIKATFLQSALSKYAQSPKLLAILDRLGVSNEIRSFVLSLPGDFQGIAVGAINKKKDIGKPELEAIINDFRIKEDLKQNTKEDIRSLIPKSTDENLKNWLVIQIRKYPEEKAFLLKYTHEIEHFVETYMIKLESYNAKTLKEVLNNTRYLSNNETGMTKTLLDTFFHQIVMKEDEKIDEVDRARLRFWANREFLRIKKEWRSNIEKVMKKENKTFEQILQEGKSIMDAQQAGQLRGQEMPKTPLHNGEHAALLINLEGINDWYENSILEIRDDETHPLHNLNNLSVNDAIEGSKKWHEEQKKKGNGIDYDPINSSNIVYGPDNWNDEENKGYFILELKSDNDLKVEGFKMNHCVGGYCDARKEGTTRIFSLRHNSSQMEPILTIETDPSGSIIRQDYGRGNSKIDKKFHNMIEEWNNNHLSSDNIDISKMSLRDLEKIATKTESKELLEKLIKTNYPEIINICIKNKYITNELLSNILNQKNGEDYAWLISRKSNLSDEILNKIYNLYLNDADKHSSIISLIKSNKLSYDFIKKILETPFGMLRFGHWIIVNYDDKNIIDYIKKESEKENNRGNSDWKIKILLNIKEANSEDELTNAYKDVHRYLALNTDKIFLMQAYLLMSKNQYASKEIINACIVASITNKEIRETLINNPLLNENQIISILNNWSDKNLEAIKPSLKRLSIDNLKDMINYPNAFETKFISDAANEELQTRLQNEKNAMNKLAQDFKNQTLVPGSKRPEELIEQSPISISPPSQDSRPQVDRLGNKRFYNSFGKLHRIGGPAVISTDGNQIWYENGTPHREDGPAAIFFNGTSKWFIQGEELPPIEVLQLLINKGRISIHDIETLKELAELTFFDYSKADTHALKQAGTLLIERGVIPTRNMHNIVAYLKAAQKL